MRKNSKLYYFIELDNHSYESKDRDSEKLIIGKDVSVSLVNNDLRESYQNFKPDEHTDDKKNDNCDSDINLDEDLYDEVYAFNHRSDDLYSTNEEEYEENSFYESSYDSDSERIKTSNPDKYTDKSEESDDDPYRLVIDEDINEDTQSKIKYSDGYIDESNQGEDGNDTDFAVGRVTNKVDAFYNCNSDKHFSVKNDLQKGDLNESLKDKLFLEKFAVLRKIKPYEEKQLAFEESGDNESGKHTFLEKKEEGKSCSESSGSRVYDAARKREEDEFSSEDGVTQDKSGSDKSFTTKIDFPKLSIWELSKDNNIDKLIIYKDSNWNIKAEGNDSEKLILDKDDALNTAEDIKSSEEKMPGKKNSFDKKDKGEPNSVSSNTRIYNVAEIKEEGELSSEDSETDTSDPDKPFTAKNDFLERHISINNNIYDLIIYQDNEWTTEVKGNDSEKLILDKDYKLNTQEDIKPNEEKKSAYGESGEKESDKQNSLNKKEKVEPNFVSSKTGIYNAAEMKEDGELSSDDSETNKPALNKKEKQIIDYANGVVPNDQRKSKNEIFSRKNGHGSFLSYNVIWCNGNSHDMQNGQYYRNKRNRSTSLNNVSENRSFLEELNDYRKCNQDYVKPTNDYYIKRYTKKIKREKHLPTETSDEDLETFYLNYVKQKRKTKAKKRKSSSSDWSPKKIKNIYGDYSKNTSKCKRRLEDHEKRNND